MVKWESLIQDLELPTIISGLVARLAAPTLQGGEKNTNPWSKPGSVRTLASGKTVEGTFPGLSKPGASGSEQKLQGQAVLAAHAQWSCPGSAPTPTPEIKISKKIVLGKMNSLYSQHKQENYIPASSTKWEK